jgi:serine/threonine protein kinase
MNYKKGKWQVQLLDFSLSQYMSSSGYLKHLPDDVAYTSNVRPPEISMGCTLRQPANEVWVIGLLLVHILHPEINMMQYRPNQSPAYNFLDYIPWRECEYLKTLPDYQNWTNPKVLVAWEHKFTKKEVWAINGCLRSNPTERLSLFDLMHAFEVVPPPALPKLIKTVRYSDDIFNDNVEENTRRAILELCTFLEPHKKAIYTAVILCTNLLPDEIGMKKGMKLMDIQKSVFDL